MDQSQAYSESIDWENYGSARERLENDCAEKIPDEGLPVFNRSLKKLELSDFSS